MEIKRIKLIGAGGIGSYFVKYLLEEGALRGQFKKLEEIEIWDIDKIEPKNALYTTYDCDSGNSNYKVDELSSWVEFQCMMHDKVIKVIKHKELADAENLMKFVYDDTAIVCAVDGSGFRSKLLKGIENRYDIFNKKNSHWIDLRSVGDEIVWARNPINTEEFLQLEPIFDDMKLENTSCQHKADLEAGIFQLGNRIVALVGVQLLLNINRGKRNGLFKIVKISEF